MLGWDVLTFVFHLTFLNITYWSRWEGWFRCHHSEHWQISVSKHQCGGCPQCPKTGARLTSGWVPKEEGTGQAAEGEGQTSQAGAQGKGKEKDTKRGAEAITLVHSVLSLHELIQGRTGCAHMYLRKMREHCRMVSQGIYAFVYMVKRKIRNTSNYIMCHVAMVWVIKLL